jgi:hypothetical protein
MKYAIRAFDWLVLVLFLSSTAAASAEHAPPGSYVQSCRNIRVVAGTLLAECRQPDGTWDISAIWRVGTCVGDIGNRNGLLACERGPLFGSERAERWRAGLRDQERRERCEGIVDPIARGHCLNGF